MKPWMPFFHAAPFFLKADDGKRTLSFNLYMSAFSLSNVLAVRSSFEKAAFPRVDQVGMYLESGRRLGEGCLVFNGGQGYPGL